METVTVWRLEDDNGFGIYDNGGPGYLREAMQDGKEMTDEEGERVIFGHRAPHEDFSLGWYEILHERACYRFGFANLEQFRNWVFRESWRTRLALMGVRLNHYEVEPDFVRIGAVQAVFHPGHAKLVETLSPDSIQFTEEAIRIR